MPKIDFPMDLRPYPENFAREMYNYRVVGRGLPHVFYKEFEDSQKAGRKVEFRFHDVVLFFAAAAAQGIIGNFAYDAIAKAVKAVRKPNKEIGGRGIRFEAVVSRKTYNRVRRKKLPGKKARQVPTSELEEHLETKYGLMVTLTRKNGR